MPAEFAPSSSASLPASLKSAQVGYLLVCPKQTEGDARVPERRDLCDPPGSLESLIITSLTCEIHLHVLRIEFLVRLSHLMILVEK